MKRSFSFNEEKIRTCERKIREEISYDIHWFREREHTALE